MSQQYTRTRPPRQQQRQPRPASDVIKLIVTGLSQSGKTRFIQSISQYTEWQAQPHNSWLFGRVRVDSKIILHFLEPPTDNQFDFIWLRDVVSKVRATGFIVMLDSTRPQTFGEFLSIVYTIRGYHNNVPMVVAANKQDQPYAWAAQDIQLGLGIRDLSVMPCVAHDRELVRDVCVDLLYQVLEN